MCSAKGYVRFTPNSDIDCVFRHVRFGFAKLSGIDNRALNRGIKLLTASDCDLTATRAAGLGFEQADELARVFAKSNTKRPICSADLIQSPDTSRSSR